MKSCGICLALLGVALMCSTATASGEGIGWQSSYASALDRSAETQKPLVIKITAPECNESAKLQQETMTDNTVVDLVSSRYVALELDAERNASLVEKFRVDSYPTTIIVNPDRRIVKRIQGYQSAASMVYELTSSLPENRRVTTFSNTPTYYNSGSS